MEFQGISKQLFEEGWIRDTADLAVVVYILTHMDIAGFCGVAGPSAPKSCRISKRKFRSILNYLSNQKKLVFSQKADKIWWKSAVNHTLFGGKCSEKQRKAVSKLFYKYANPEDFGIFFAMWAANYLKIKYSLDIPIVSPKHTPPEWVSEPYYSYSYSYIQNNNNSYTGKEFTISPEEQEKDPKKNINKKGFNSIVRRKDILLEKLKDDYGIDISEIKINFALREVEDLDDNQIMEICENTTPGGGANNTAGFMSDWLRRAKEYRKLK